MNSTANMNVTDVGEKKKRVIKNPQPKLNAERLMGPRGIHTIEELFKVIVSGDLCYIPPKINLNCVFHYKIMRQWKK